LRSRKRINRLRKDGRSRAFRASGHAGGRVEYGANSVRSKQGAPQEAECTANITRIALLWDFNVAVQHPNICTSKCQLKAAVQQKYAATGKLLQGTAASKLQQANCSKQTAASKLQQERGPDSHPRYALERAEATLSPPSQDPIHRRQCGGKGA
jgi:hypothetical protein